MLISKECNFLTAKYDLLESKPTSKGKPTLLFSPKFHLEVFFCECKKPKNKFYSKRMHDNFMLIKRERDKDKFVHCTIKTVARV